MENFFGSKGSQSIVSLFKIAMLFPLALINAFSAGIFQDVAVFCGLEQVTFPALVLSINLGILFVCHAIKTRFHSKSFSCDFTLTIGFSVSLIIGSLYSLMNQRNFLQEQLFKILTTILLSNLLNRTILTLKKEGSSNCPICLQQLGKRMIELKCGHTFHQSCLWRWIETKRVCPLCLAPV